MEKVIQFLGKSYLIEKAIKKAGNLNQVCKVVGMSTPTFYNLVNKKGIKMISVKKLRQLLNYLTISYININKKIDYTLEKYFLKIGVEIR